MQQQNDTLTNKENIYIGTPVNKLEKYLKHRGISQRRFSELIKTTPNHLGLLVKSRVTPSLKMAYRIEKETGGLVTLYDWLPQETEEPEKDQKTL